MVLRYLLYDVGVLKKGFKIWLQFIFALICVRNIFRDELKYLKKHIWNSHAHPLLFISLLSHVYHVAVNVLMLILPRNAGKLFSPEFILRISSSNAGQNALPLIAIAVEFRSFTVQKTSQGTGSFHQGILLFQGPL